MVPDRLSYVEPLPHVAVGISEFPPDRLLSAGTTETVNLGRDTVGGFEVEVGIAIHGRSDQLCPVEGDEHLAGEGSDFNPSHSSDFTADLTSATEGRRSKRCLAGLKT